jgi:penicillin amidase
MTHHATDAIPVPGGSPSPGSAPSRAVRRIGTGLYLLGIAGLLVVALLLVYAHRLRFVPLPGQARLASLAAGVEVVQDTDGTFHVLAGDWPDALRAQGWLHARDRLWQMEVGRLTARGRLAELVGPPGVGFDRVLRTLGLAEAARAQTARLPEGVRVRLQAYVEGVNAWLEGPHCRLPPELVLLGRHPEPWTLEDSVALLDLIALTLASNWQQEAVFAALEARFGEERTALLRPDPIPPVGRPTIGGSGGEVALWAGLAAGIGVLQQALAPGAAGAGSNAWAVAPARSAGGRALLANDPHLGVQMPSLWSAMGLHLPGWDLVGVSLPGVPGVVLGRTPVYAWAFTNTMADDQDLYLERTDPEDPGRYLFRGEWQPLEVRTETIRVRGGRPVTVRVERTRHGPLIDGVLRELLDFKDRAARADHGPAPDDPAAAEPPAGRRVALRWAALESDSALLALDRLLDARDLEGALAAMRHFTSPGQNVILADTSGTLHYQFTGAVPLRRDWDGSRPLEGWTGEHEWAGLVPFEGLPAVRNPADGLLVSANDRPPGSGAGPFLGRWWSDPARAERLREALTASVRHDPEGFARLQLDLVSPNAIGLVGRLADLPRSGPYTARAREVLAGWEGRIEGSGPALLYERFLAGLLPAVLEDELGPALLADYLSALEFYDGVYPVARRLLETSEAPWWDDVRTSQREEREEVLEGLWERCWREVTDREVTDPAGWRWDRVHTITFRHPAGRFAPLSRLLDRGPFGLDGDRDTLRRALYTLNDPFEVTAAASWRQVVELGPVVRAWTILPTGNEAHFLSPHYDDQIGDWLAGRLRPAPTSRREVEAAAQRRLRLLPAARPPEGR